MRKLFKEYYSPSKSEFDILWKEGAIVLDTNVLLRLHLFGKSTVDNIFSILDNLKDRLWLPFQVAEEFHRNRRDKIAEATKPLASILSDLKNCENSINNTLENLGKSVSIHPIVELEPTIKSTIEAIRAQRTGLEGRISEISTDPYYESILERVSNLFSNIVGNDVEEKHYKDLISEGIERMQSNVPPGYKDYTEKKKRGQSDREALGDFLIWKQIIAYVNDTKRHIILVTEDRKPDWWQVESGKTVGPRVELRREFFRATGNLFHMYNLESFLEHASNISKIKLNESSKKEIKQSEVRVLQWDNKLDLDIKELYGEVIKSLNKERIAGNIKLKNFNNVRYNIEDTECFIEDGEFESSLNVNDIRLNLANIDKKLFNNSRDSRLLSSRLDQIRRKSQSFSLSESEFDELVALPEKMELCSNERKRLLNDRLHWSSLIKDKEAKNTSTLQKSHNLVDPTDSGDADPDLQY